MEAMVLPPSLPPMPPTSPMSAKSSPRHRVVLQKSSQDEASVRRMFSVAFVSSNLGAAETIKRCLDIMHSHAHDGGVQQYGCQALCSMASKKLYVREIISNGGLDQLMGILTNPESSDSCLCMAVGCLKKLTVEDDMADLLRSKKVVRTVLDLCKKKASLSGLHAEAAGLVMQFKKVEGHVDDLTEDIVTLFFSSIVLHGQDKDLVIVELTAMLLLLKSASDELCLLLMRDKNFSSMVATIYEYHLGDVDVCCYTFEMVSEMARTLKHAQQLQDTAYYMLAEDALDFDLPPLLEAVIAAISALQVHCSVGAYLSPLEALLQRLSDPDLVAVSMRAVRMSTLALLSRICSSSLPSSGALLLIQAGAAHALVSCCQSLDGEQMPMFVLCEIVRMLHVLCVKASSTVVTGAAGMNDKIVVAFYQSGALDIVIEVMAHRNAAADAIVHGLKMLEAFTASSFPMARLALALEQGTVRVLLAVYRKAMRDRVERVAAAVVLYLAKLARLVHSSEIIEQIEKHRGLMIIVRLTETHAEMLEHAKAVLMLAARCFMWLDKEPAVVTVKALMAAHPRSNEVQAQGVQLLRQLEQRRDALVVKVRSTVSATLFTRKTSDAAPLARITAFDENARRSSMGKRNSSSV